MNNAISVLNKFNPSKVWNAFRRWPIIPVAILAILLFTGIFAPLLAPQSPTAQTLKLRNAPPSWMENGTPGNFWELIMLGVMFLVELFMEQGFHFLWLLFL